MTASRTYLMVDFAVMGERATMKVWTNLKVAVSQFNANDDGSKPITLHYAWLKSSTGSTVGKLKDATPDSRPYYQAVAPGTDLFVSVLKGVHASGVVIGYQENLGGLDSTVESEGPPPPDVRAKLTSCLVDFTAALRSERFPGT
jgi:hypothetical protein